MVAMRRPASKPGHATTSRQGKRSKSDEWHGPGLLDSELIVLLKAAEHAGNCMLHDLLCQHVRHEPKGAEHSLSKNILACGKLKTLKDYHEALDMAGGAEDMILCAQADSLRSMMQEKIGTVFESFGPEEFHQIHTFSFLVDHHRGRDWGIKLLPTSAATSSEPDDLTPPEESDEETEKLRQAWLQAAQASRNAKKKARDARKTAEQAEKCKIAAWHAFTSVQKAAMSKVSTATAGQMRADG